MPKIGKSQGRRTQAQRSRLTHDKVVAATFRLLHRHGYAGASLTAIAEAARISLGALQHQFPTKALLMAAVLRRFAAKRFLTYRAALRGVQPGLARFAALSEASWSFIGSKELSASMAVELAARNDPELAAAIKPTLARHGAFVRRLISTMLRNNEPPNDRRLESLRILNNAIMFGLSIERIRNSDQRLIDGALALWKEQLVTIVGGNDNDR
jgi:AcrR family transcriptional regulator